MSLLLRSRGACLAIGLGACAAFALVAPSACLFSDYTFDEPEPTGGSGATGTTTSGGGSTATVTMNPEDCTNGIDDDGDGGIDCADVKCTDHACVSEVPAGWEGYFALYDGPPAQDPGCPAAFPSASKTPYIGNRGINVPPATCTCSCGAATGQTCAALDTITMSTRDAPCGMTNYCTGPLDAPAGWNGSCYGPSYFPSVTTCGQGSMCTTQTGIACTQSLSATALEASGGQCAATPVQVTLPDVTWAQLGHACGDSGALGQGCNIGQVCLPRPAAPFESGVCISMAGDNPCPPGAFTEKHVFYANTMDTRDCTDDCSCGAPSGGTCPTTITIYSDTSPDTCITTIASFPAGTCTNVAGNPTVSGRKASPPGAPTGGTCTPSGGTATGTATEIDPTTFCCTP